MAITSYINLKYGNLRDELMKLVMGDIPTGAEYVFRRMLKEAQNLLINEATVAPDSISQRTVTVEKSGETFSLSNGEQSVVQARTGSGRTYTIVDVFSYTPVTSRSSVGYPIPLLVDLGSDEKGLRSYRVLNGEHARQVPGGPGVASENITLYLQIAQAPLSGNIFDDNYWTNDLVVIPNCYPAFKSMLLYVRFMELGNTAQALDYYNMAVKTLNDHLRKNRQGTLITPKIVNNLGPGQASPFIPM